MRLRLLLAIAAFSIGCSRPTREWRPDDHDQEPAGAAAGPPGAVNPNASAMAAQMSDEELAGVVDGVWKNACTPCHGLLGRGDGPQGPMVGAPDLGAAAVQGRTDEQLASSIKTGKGKMPGFGKMPPVFIVGLVGKVRSFKAP